MKMALCLYDTRRALPVLVSLIVLVFACFLLTPGPLVSGVMTSMLGGIIGLMIAIVLFADPPGTAGFVWSRGLSRRRIFGNRWVMGVLLIAFLAIVAWCIVTTGLRSTVRHEARWSDRPLYPTIAGLESVAAIDVAIKGFQVFCVMSFIMVMRALTASRNEQSAGDSLRPFVVAGLLIPLVLVFDLTGRFLVPAGESGLIAGLPDNALKIYVAVSSLLCAAAAWWHARNLEAES